ncbi:glutathione S-transferase family protein [Geitlerinema sp. PCC 7407]|uniref:glutathione S-transferase family protein n=1 Tax=Geitlerinema sp. PCC 7407 TaxID=1173025 RepID=UPI00029F925E|nr:glutathione S-transferase family protein [Geitlerinema sp. PCC 7407]AFY66459.1 Glutathione S-transferase domain protein [Geitlerinema sp. PCC 7407]
MLELYQFEMSHYSEKVRLILDYKGLAYRTVEVTPGLGQFDLYRMSGQRQVPVLKDGTQVIADSTAIALYLERQYPDRPILPTDARDRALCLMMESWADEVIGTKGRIAMLAAFSQDPSFRTSALPSSTPDIIRNLVSAVPGDPLRALDDLTGAKAAREELKQALESLSALLLDRPYLIGDQPTLADFAVAGLSMYLKFPAGPYLRIPETLKGRGVPGLADSPEYAGFFAWRDRLYDDYRKPPLSPAEPTNDDAPKRIVID